MKTFVALLAVALVLGSAVARAAGPKDASALKLDADAMTKDYLETRFPQAKTKLDKAISTCGAGAACSDGVKARLHRDLGVVLLATNKSDDAKKEFKKARELDGKLTLDKDFATPPMKKLWAEAGGGASDAPKLDHVAVTEQKIGFPVPISANVDGGPAEAMVKLWYKAPDATTWAHTNMGKRGDGFAAEIPCSATGSAGTVSYFVAVHGPDGETLASSGSREEPLKLEVKKDLDGEAPKYADGEAPKRCGGAGDAAPPEVAGEAKKNWFFLTFEQDLALIGTGTGICAPDIQAEGQWACFRSNGSLYRGNPVHGQGDAVNGGASIASTRIHVGYDRVIAGGLTLGARFGVVIRGSAPSSSDSAAGHSPLPVSFEARAAYWFGSDPFGTAGFRPFLLVDGGVASVDTERQTSVREDTTVVPTQQNPATQSLDAWKSLGNGFVGGGLGLMYAFTPRAGLFIDMRYARFLGRGGNALAPEVGFGFGL